jgi:hypothetical protein
LLPLKNNCYITSDHGIYAILNAMKCDILYVDPADILLPGFPHGFFGGACGIHENKVYITGSLKKYKHGEMVKEYLLSNNYEIIELYDGPLFDCGSILIL